MRCISITPATGGVEDSRDLADPNPFVIRKDRAEKANAKRVWPQFKLPFGGKAV